MEKIKIILSFSALILIFSAAQSLAQNNRLKALLELQNEVYLITENKEAIFNHLKKDLKLLKELYDRYKFIEESPDDAKNWEKSISILEEQSKLSEGIENIKYNINTKLSSFGIKWLYIYTEWDFGRLISCIEDAKETLESVKRAIKIEMIKSAQTARKLPAHPIILQPPTTHIVPNTPTPAYVYPFRDLSISRII